MNLRNLGFLVSVAGALAGFGSGVHAQAWTGSFTDRGVNYTLSDLTASSSSSQQYSLVLNTTGYTGPSGAFLDSVNIKAWSAGSSDVSFTLLSAPGGIDHWLRRTEGLISSGPVSNTGCGGSGAGFACVEASTKNMFSVASGSSYEFRFSVEAPSAASFLNSPFGAHVGAGYANSSGRGTGFGITSVTMIPEPEIYAMLLAGLGLMGFVARRRQRYSA